MIIRVTLTPEQADKLVDAVNQGLLSEFNVRKAEIASPPREDTIQPDGRHLRGLVRLGVIAFQFLLMLTCMLLVVYYHIMWFFALTWWGACTYMYELVCKVFNARSAKGHWKLLAILRSLHARSLLDVICVTLGWCMLLAAVVTLEVLSQSFLIDVGPVMYVLIIVMMLAGGYCASVAIQRWHKCAPKKWLRLYVLCVFAFVTSVLPIIIYRFVFLFHFSMYHVFIVVAIVYLIPNLIVNVLLPETHLTSRDRWWSILVSWLPTPNASEEGHQHGQGTDAHTTTSPGDKEQS